MLNYVVDALSSLLLFQAWMCSRSFNNLLASLGQGRCVRYLIAGGDKALIVGDELPEDDPPRGGHGGIIYLHTLYYFPCL